MHQGQPSQLGGCGHRGARTVGDHVDLQLPAPAVRVRRQHEDREPVVPVDHQVDAGAHGRLHLAVRPAGEAAPRDVPRRRTVAVGVQPQQVAQAELPVLVVDHPDQPVRALPRAQPGVQPGLHVDLLVRRPGLLDHLEVVERHLEVVGQQLGERGPVHGPGRGDHAAAYSSGELAHVGQPQVVVAVHAVSVLLRKFSGGR